MSNPVLRVPAGAAGARKLGTTGQRVQTAQDIASVGSSIWGLGVSGYAIADAIKDSKRGIEDIKREVHGRGLTYPGENRRGLIAAGAMPVIYANEQIIKDLKGGVLPAGWSWANAEQQGYGEWADEGRRKNRQLERLKTISSRRSVVRSI